MKPLEAVQRVLGGFARALVRLWLGLSGLGFRGLGFRGLGFRGLGV